MRRGSRTTLLQLILSTLVALSSGASITRDADPECTYPTGKFNIGNLADEHAILPYLGFNTALQVFVPTTVDDAAIFQFRYCGTGTGPNNTFEIALIDRNNKNVGYLGSVGQPATSITAWGTTDMLLAVVDHSESSETGSYINPAFSAAEGLPTQSQIWYLSESDLDSGWLNVYVRMYGTDSKWYEIVTQVMGVNDWSLPSASGPVNPLFLNPPQYVPWTFVSTPLPTVSANGQCGGTGYTGPTQCAAGYVCTDLIPYYSQCLPFDATSCHSSTTQSLNQPCGSSDSPNHRSCGSQAVCVSSGGTSPYKCQPLDANSAVPCPPQTVPADGQCGGIGYTGPTQCAAGLACTEMSSYYSQCLPFDATSCHSSTTQSLNKPCGSSDSPNHRSCGSQAVCVSSGGTSPYDCRTLDANSAVPCPS